MAENNKAIVVKVNKTEEIPGMDRIQLVKLFGTQVITSKEVKEGDIMIYVDSNMKMSPGFLSSNNLYRNTLLNKDSGKSGYFDDNGRVKAIKMKGVISDGFLFPPSYIFDNFDPGKPGYEFNEIGGYKICEKYIPPQNQEGNGSGKKKGAGRNTPKAPMFVEHFDTTQFMRNKQKIPAQTVCYIEEKIHGTSHRTGNVLVNTDHKRNWFQKLGMKIAGIKSLFNYTYLNGTRRVVHAPNKKQKNPYHNNSMREEVLENVKGQLLKGEQLYMELFGYEKTGKMIQKDFPYGCQSQLDTEEYSGPETYGMNITLNKGTQYKSMLYRVTMNNEDGNIVDYPREYVYNRAEELGLEKPHLFEKFYYSGTKRSMEILEEKVIQHAQGQSAIANDTLREGVVIWFINDNGRWEALKYKSDAYRLKESGLKDKGYTDVEDAA